LRHHRKLLASVPVAVSLAAGAVFIGLTGSSASPLKKPLPDSTTPIKHVVVIFDENVSFDHYFGTYPNAANTDGSKFVPLPHTPTVNGLTPALLNDNPNEFNPQRLSPSQALTCDQNHGYSAEQAADDGGLLDKFVQDTTGGGCTQSTTPDSSSYGPPGIVMDYYDGNTVTAMWNLAQHFALNDNSYGTAFGPSTPGAVNLVSGNTNGAVSEGGTTSPDIANGTLFSDAEPYFDLCSNNTTADTGTSGDAFPGGSTVELTGENVGDLMNAKGVTWGWFQGGFAPGATVPAGTGSVTLTDAGTSKSYAEGPVARPACNASHLNVGGASIQDYVEHHDPFQYYASTANPMHNAPASVADVGYSDPSGTPLDSAVDHQYDISWFSKALQAGDMPQVSFLKPPAYQNAHPGNSDPLDEQNFIVNTINQIEESKYWSSTAIIINYDDSDGWYDHQMGPIIRQSEDTLDALNGPGKCGSSATPPAQNDRCGVGPRLPLLVISPYAKRNYVDSTFTEQASVLQFIEQNWKLGSIGNGSADAGAGSIDGMFDFNPHGRRSPAIIMSPTTGEITHVIGGGGPWGWGGAHGVRHSASMPKLACSISGHSPRFAVTCATRGRAKAARAARGAKIAILLRQDGRLAVDRHGRLGRAIKLRAKLRGAYTLAVDIAGSVEVIGTVHLS
jgi:phospholipase C